MFGGQRLQVCWLAKILYQFFNLRGFTATQGVMRKNHHYIRGMWLYGSALPAWKQCYAQILSQPPSGIRQRPAPIYRISLLSLVKRF